MTSPSTIAVIGAGFSGTVLAARLLRDANRPIRVKLVNRSGRMARGVAYGTRSHLHVLNVPAGRMSALPEDEGHFLRFAQSTDANVAGGTFVPRSLYGDYLENLLSESVEAARTRGAGATLEQIVGEAIDLWIDDSGVHIKLRDGQTIEADVAVLASGNYPPADPVVGNTAMFLSDRYIKDPWAGGALSKVRSDEEVLLIGTGLTMFDVALELSRRRGVQSMHAVSRRGLLPQPHRGHAAPPSVDHFPPDLFDFPGEPRVRHYLRSVRRHVDRVKDQGIDWRDVIASLRAITPRMWQTIPAGERRRFLRRLRPYWDVHRHRAAPEISGAVEELMNDGRLKVAAGRIGGAKDHHGRLEVTIQLRRNESGVPGETALRVDRVINCTGPDSDVSSIKDSLIESLRRRGLSRPDETGIGLDVADDYRLINRDGAPVERLFLLGPLLRGKLWEATAVPELRVHAANVARALQ